MRLYYEIIAKYSHSNWEVKDSLMLIYKRSPWPFYIRFSMCILLQQPWDNKSIFAKIACDKVKTKNSPLTLKVKGSHDFVMLQGNAVARFGYTCSPEGTIKGNQYKTAPIDHFNHMKNLFYSDVSNPSYRLWGAVFTATGSQPSWTHMGKTFLYWFFFIFFTCLYFALSNRHIFWK